eukprot:TRINITY_DN11774_c0_g1_i1.p1 TRINITY_DN11774_c0_g1~~TRINITY_DN11774_c0_g1_i1.p1  ORF type:complete len:552 (-),score=123.80 TRINITY_DN11774_c0_g1_i1:82-1710(-)
MGTVSSSDDRHGRREINEDYIHESDVNRNFIHGEYIVPGPAYESLYVAGRATLQCSCGAHFMDDSNYCRKCGAERQQVEKISKVEAEETDVLGELKRLQDSLPAALAAAEQAQATARSKTEIAEKVAREAMHAESIAAEFRAKHEAREAVKRQAFDAANNAQANAKMLADEAAMKAAEAAEFARLEQESQQALNASRAQARAAEAEADRHSPGPVDPTVYARALANIQAQESRVESLLHAAAEARATADRMAREAAEAEFELQNLRAAPVIQQWAKKDEADRLVRDTQRYFEAVNQLESQVAERSREAALAAEAARRALEAARQAEADAAKLQAEADRVETVDEEFYPCADIGNGQLRYESAVKSAQLAGEASASARDAADAASARAAQLCQHVQNLKEKLARAKELVARLCPTRCACGQLFVWDANFCRFCGRPRMQAWAWDSIKPAPMGFQYDEAGRGFPPEAGPKSAGYNELVTELVWQAEQEQQCGACEAGRSEPPGTPLSQVPLSQVPMIAGTPQVAPPVLPQHAGADPYVAGFRAV